jgi:hypothetical protein
MNIWGEKPGKLLRNKRNGTRLNFRCMRDRFDLHISLHQQNLIALEMEIRVLNPFRLICERQHKRVTCWEASSITLYRKQCLFAKSILLTFSHPFNWKYPLTVGQCIPLIECSILLCYTQMGATALIRFGDMSELKLRKRNCQVNGFQKCGCSPAYSAGVFGDICWVVWKRSFNLWVGYLFHV